MEDHLVYRWVTVQELECTMQEKTPMYDEGDTDVLNMSLGGKVSTPGPSSSAKVVTPPPWWTDNTWSSTSPVLEMLCRHANLHGIPKGAGKIVFTQSNTSLIPVVTAQLLSVE